MKPNNQQNHHTLSQASTAVRPRILAVLAHPDDESFGMGGTLAYYAHCGAAVYLVCATNGDVGEVDAHHMRGYETIAALRQAELRCAAAALNLTDVFLLGYRDSGMPGSPDNHHPQALVAAPLEAVSAAVMHYIHHVRPHVVLTFDPIGGYRHPDHIAMHRATVAAFHTVVNDALQNNTQCNYPQKLYFHTFPRTLLRITVAIMQLMGKDPRRFGRNHDIDLASIAAESFPTHTSIDYITVAQRKMAAAQCHASQGGGSSIVRGVFSWVARIIGYGYRDSFMRAYPPPTANLHEHDLFEGIDMDVVEKTITGLTQAPFDLP